MARDRRLPMRNALVIPGALLIFYGLLAIIYGEQVRARSDYCADSNLILIAGVCYTVWKMLLPLVLIGFALVITGVTAFRGEPDELEGHLHHGTAAHTGLSLLVSLVVVGFTAWLIQTIREARSGETFELNILGARYEHTFLLELLILVGLLMLIPFLAMYISLHVKRRRFEQAAQELLEEEQEPRLPHERGYEYGRPVPASQTQAVPMVPDEEWPDERDDDETPTYRPCKGRDGSLPCPNPAQEGMDYCPIHACRGSTREGAPCRNPAMPGEPYCPVHARRGPT